VSIYPADHTVTGEVLPPEFGPRTPPPDFFAEDAPEAGPVDSQRHGVERVRCLFCVRAGQVVLRLEEAAFVCGYCGARWGPSYVREVMDRWETVLQLVDLMPRKDGNR
jgi:hypothetical protein